MSVDPPARSSTHTAAPASGTAGPARDWTRTLLPLLTATSTRRELDQDVTSSSSGFRPEAAAVRRSACQYHPPRSLPATRWRLTRLRAGVPPAARARLACHAPQPAVPRAHDVPGNVGSAEWATSRLNKRTRECATLRAQHTTHAVPTDVHVSLGACFAGSSSLGMRAIMQRVVGVCVCVGEVGWWLGAGATSSASTFSSLRI